MDKEQENQFKENIKEIARLELKNSFNNNLMETLNSTFIFKYVDTLEKQNQKYKELFDNIKKYIEPLITNRDNQQCYPISWYSKDVLLQILKEVE